MLVTMMGIWVMRVFVLHGFVPVGVCMRLLAAPFRPMAMLMMFIVCMRVLVF